MSLCMVQWFGDNDLCLAFCMLAFLKREKPRPLQTNDLQEISVIVTAAATILQSNPYKMFAAYFQPSWPSRPKTNVTLLFYFLKLYNSGLNEIFVGSTSSELQHPWISKITTEPKKKSQKKKIDFRAEFRSTSNQ